MNMNGNCLALILFHSKFNQIEITINLINFVCFAKKGLPKPEIIS